MKCDAVFEGGGMKGIAFIGAIKETEKQGYVFQQLAGTSAGAMIASLLAAGYQGKELEGFASELRFDQYLKPGMIGRLPLIGTLWNVAVHYGIYSIHPFEKWLSEKLAARGVETFADLPPGKLRVIASDITNERMIVLPDHLAKYGIDADRFPVSVAVGMSMSIPYFFRPVRIQLGRKATFIVDGGLLSNYPLWIFDRNEQPRWPTFGFRLRAAEFQSNGKIRGPFTMLRAIISTMLEARDARYIQKKDAVRTVFIPVQHVKATDFSLSNDKIEHLIRIGQEETEAFFTKWNFQKYVSQFRSCSEQIRSNDAGSSPKTRISGRQSL